MTDFKIVWRENNDGDHSEHSMIITADTEDDACDIWERDIEPNVPTNGMQSCVEVVESPLFKRCIYVDMPDCMRYAIPVEIIARNRAASYAKTDYDNDVTKSLREDTLPLFESNDDEIIDWAQNNMNWSDVKDHAYIVLRKTNDDAFQDAWVNGDHEISAVLGDES